MLSIKNLVVSVGEQVILRGINLEVAAGEVHAVMGPNGAGKSTLAAVLAGKPGYQVEQGSVEFLGQDLLTLSPEQRAVAGLFLGFQYPVEIPGVNNMYFLRTAVNSVRQQRGQSEYDAMDFMALLKQKSQAVQMDEKFMHRALNEGFSGGEKKRNEILQMLLMEPTLAVLDETDSGLDIDALQAVSQGVNSMRDATRGFIVITHYQRLLNYIKPDYVHVLMAGRMVRSGDYSLALALEEKGYGWLENENAIA